jgi:metal-dependent amidase/aminoacylase/carboxypeptidase family protein
MADDWRVTASLHEEGLVERLLDRLRRHEVEDAVVARLGGRVAVSSGPSRIFVYADGEGAAREVERLLQEACAAHGLEAEIAVHRWHPIAGRWEDPSVPLPQTDTEREAERKRLEQTEAEESQRTGLAEWEVRVEVASHDDAEALAESLEGEGMKPVRRWTYVVVGANTQDEAKELAERLQREAPAGSEIRVESGPAMAREGTAGTLFAAWFD